MYKYKSNDILKIYSGKTLVYDAVTDIIKNTFKENDNGFWYDFDPHIKDNWRINMLSNSVDFDIWAKGFSAVKQSDGWLLTSTEANPSGYAFSTLYPMGATASALGAGTIIRSIEFKKGTGHILRFGGASDIAAIFVDLSTLTIPRNGGNLPYTITPLEDDWYRLELFHYSTLHATTALSHVFGWALDRNTSQLVTTDQIGTTFYARKPAFTFIPYESYTSVPYQEITTEVDLFKQIHPNLTLYQDGSGTIPVTSVGQPIGLILDKSKNLERGPELWLNNPTYVAPSARVTDTSYRIQSLDGSLSQVSGPVTNMSNKWCEIEFTIDSISGSLTTDFANTPIWNTTGTKKFIGLFISSTITFKRSGIMDATISNISVKELKGNHARQSTSSARPILCRHPISGIRNLLTYSGNFTNSTWIFAGTRVGGQLDSNFTYTATRLFGASTNPTYKSVTAPKDGSYTYTICIKSGSESQQSATLLIRNSTLSQNYTIGYINLITGVISGTGWTSKQKANGFWECSYTQNNITTGDVLYLYYANTSAATTESFDVIIDYAQFEYGSIATTFQITTSLSDITEKDTVDIWYLKFDGIDDYIQTNPFALPKPFSTMHSANWQLGTATYAILSGGASGYFYILSASRFGLQQNTLDPQMFVYRNQIDTLYFKSDNDNVFIKSNIASETRTDLINTDPYKILATKFIGRFNGSSGSASNMNYYGGMAINRILSNEEEALIRKVYNINNGG